MATGSRDVTLTLSVETLGDDGIKKLQSAVAALAQEGGNAGPEFQQLANELERLGDQNSALQTFKQLSEETDQLRAKQEQSAQTMQEMATRLETLSAAANEAALKQREASQAYIDGQKTIIALSTEIKELKASYDTAGRQTEEYRSKLTTLTAAQGAAQAELIDLRNAQKAANTEYTTATLAVEKLETTYKRQEAAVTSASQALKAQQSTLDAAAAAANALGVATDDIAASEGRLQAVFNSGKAAIEANTASVKALEVAQGLLTTELELQAIAASKLVQEEQRLAAQQQQAAHATTQATNEVAAASRAAAADISNAFRTVGVRSVEELQRELNETRAAMVTLQGVSQTTGNTMRGAFESGEAKIRGIERSIRELNGEMTLADRASKLFSNSMGQIAAGNIIADGVGYLVNKVKDLGRAFIETIVQGDQLRRGLNALYGDVGVTASQMLFLRKASSDSGVAFSSLSGDFLKFSASMKSANIPLAQSNELFKAVTAASASLGLGAEETAGTLNALGQMASKGTVSMEELRQQLGDRLPGALGLTAKGFGITEAQLIKLVESGGLATRDFVGPFTKALQGLKGESDGLVPTFERLKGSLQTVAQGVGEAGGVTLLTGALKVLGGAVAFVVAALSGFTEALFLAGAATVAFFARLSGDKQAWDFFNEQVAKSAERLTEQRAAFVAMIDPSKAVTASVTEHSVALTQNTAEVVKSISANTSLDAAQKMAALSVALAGDATLDASAKLVQYNVAAAELIKAQQVQTEAYEKLAKAAKEQGDSLVQLAKLNGDAEGISRASAEAAKLHADALALVNKSHETELALLIGKKTALLESAKARGLSAQQIKVETDALDEKIKKSQAETEQSKQVADAAQQELKIRQLSIATYGDQSAKVGEYKTNLEQLKATLADYLDKLKQGKATEEEVKNIREQVAVATVKYKDALTDLADKQKQETEFKRDSLKVTSEVLNGEIQLYTARAQQARAIGDLTTAAYYEIEAKKKKLEIDKIAIEIKEIELKLERAEIELKLEKLKLEEPENALKRQKLEMELKLNDMRLKGIDSSKQLIALQDLELTKTIGLNGALSTNTGVRDSNTGSMDRQTTALEKLNSEREREMDAIDKAAELDRKRDHVDINGFATGRDGNTIVQQIENRDSVYNRAKSAGLSATEADAISKQFISDSGQQTGHFGLANTAAGENWYTVLQREINKRVRENDLAKENGGTMGTTGTTGNNVGTLTTPKSTLTPNPPTLGTTVNINLNGVNTAVKTDAAGAAALQALLTNLTTASRTAL